MTTYAYASIIDYVNDANKPIILIIKEFTFSKKLKIQN